MCVPLSLDGLRQGPRAELHFNPREVRAAIVTCGGLCPGLNSVVHHLVNTLLRTYKAEKVRRPACRRLDVQYWTCVLECIFGEVNTKSNTKRSRILTSVISGAVAVEAFLLTNDGLLFVLLRVASRCLLGVRRRHASCFQTADSNRPVFLESRESYEREYHYSS